MCCPIRKIATLLLLACAAGAPLAQVHSRSALIQCQTSTFAVSGIQPGDLVLIFYGLDGLGTGLCVPPPIDLCIGLLGSPRFFPLQTADAAGIASFQIRVPPGLPLIPVASQAFVVTPLPGGDFSFFLTNTIETAVQAISDLSDTFDGPSLDPSWSVHRPEILTSTIVGGELRIQNSGLAAWFSDGEGQMIYKLVTGDFTVTCLARTEDADNPGLPPPLSWHLGGLIVRDPASTSGQANWLHLVVGSATSGVPIALEDKNTVNSMSILRLTPLTSPEAELRIDRIGSQIDMYYRTASVDPWSLVRSFDRPDLPETLQVGMGLSGPLRALLKIDSICFSK